MYEAAVRKSIHVCFRQRHPSGISMCSDKKMGNNLPDILTPAARLGHKQVKGDRTKQRLNQSKDLLSFISDDGGMEFDLSFAGLWST